MNTLFSPPIAAVRRHFYALAHWGTAEARFLAAHSLPMADINAHAGGFFVLPCLYGDGGFFEFSEAGTASVVFEVLDSDDETVLDLCAFPVDDPGRFARAIGVAPVLGLTNISNPASWAFGSYPKIHRRPLDWLKDGCQGVVILDHRSAGLALGEALGPLVAEDMEHARDLKAMLCQPPVDPKNILYPVVENRRAA